MIRRFIWKTPNLNHHRKLENFLFTIFPNHYMLSRKKPLRNELTRLVVIGVKIRNFKFVISSMNMIFNSKHTFQL
jgi:hypothetical protein